MSREHLGEMPEERVTMAREGLRQLTKRERQVLDLIARALTNKQAGDILRISPRTVEVHRTRVFEKLGVKNAADLVSVLAALP